MKVVVGASRRTTAISFGSRTTKMAAVMGVRIRQFTKILVQSSFNQCRHLKTRQVLYFRNSAFLNVKGQEIKMPSLSPTMSEGTIVKWLKKEGDPVAAGDVLCDIQTDKAVVSFEFEEDGILAKILVPENTPDIKVGTLIALMVNEGEDWRNVEVPTTQGGGDSSHDTASSGSDSDSGSGSAQIPGASFQTATLMSYGPAVRYLLEKYDIKVNMIKPTGNRNKLLKEDVLKYIKDNKLTEKPLKSVSPPAPSTTQPAKKPAMITKDLKQLEASFKDLEVSSMRKTIARRLTESKLHIPHSYGTIECNISKLLEFRKMLKSEGIKVSVNDFVIKAAACALQQHPDVNVHWIQDKVVLIPDIDISVAVATDSGLITPIIKDVTRKGIVEISGNVKELAERARIGKLLPHEFQGGSFTISNLGMFGVTEFSAIINPPQCAILAVGTGTSGIDHDENPCVTMCLTLSYDRRAFDEGIAAEFLSTVQTMLQDPSMMVLGAQQNIQVKRDI